jgi:trans-L-3-hydroxyproline dehydratase
MLKNQIQNSQLQVPESWLKIKTIDMHTGGEPLRVILSGFPSLHGSSILEKRSELKEKHDHLRTGLMFEPRGHADMYGCLITEPEHPDSDFGIIFMHNEGYSTMCGHATLAITKLAVELGWVEKIEPTTTINIDAPCGTLTAYATVQNGQVKSMSFDNVPSFVVGLDLPVHIDGIGQITYDLAYGGAYYAIVDADVLGLSLDAEHYQQLIDWGKKVKHAVTKEREIQHPVEKDLGFLYGTIFTGKPHGSADSRNVCVFADGEVDRSPTGSGVSARLAIHHKRGELAIG